MGNKGTSQFLHGIHAPLLISTPKLISIHENCIIDEKFVGVLTPINGYEFGFMVMQKINDYTENSQK